MLPAAGEARRATSSPTTTSAMELLAEQVEIARGDRLVHVVVDVGDREVSGRIEAGMQIVEIHSSEGYRRVICSRAAKTANVYPGILANLLDADFLRRDGVGEPKHVSCMKTENGIGAVLSPTLDRDAVGTQDKPIVPRVAS